MSSEACASAREVFERLQRRFETRGGLSLAERQSALRALRSGLRQRAEKFAAEISADFGYRSRHETLLTEIVVVLQAVDYTLARLSRWARPSRVALTPPIWPARAWTTPVPRGVACVMGPSNYPLQLALMPVIASLSAGCPTLLKPSEMTPRTADGIAALAREHLDPEAVGVVCGGGEVGAMLSSLPFGAILFTGSGAVGAKVASAAAANLTPLVLELGGKSPAFIDRHSDAKRAAETIIAGKLLNAGQTCVAPDYVLAVASERARARLQSLEAGLDIVPLFETPPPRYRPALALAPSLESKVMREEIFGPLLPVIPYADIDEAIAVVRSLPAPLALYWFGDKNARFFRVLERTRAGAVALNETVLHAGVSALPFGGIGASGYGRYHGRAGFESFSHQQVVFEQSRWSLTRLLRPPFGARAERIIQWLVGADEGD
jgi:coniferyl-aldehyde dehydrogenase